MKLLNNSEFGSWKHWSKIMAEITRTRRATVAQVSNKRHNKVKEEEDEVDKHPPPNKSTIKLKESDPRHCCQQAWATVPVYQFNYLIPNCTFHFLFSF
jgi:hypothetical protein